MAKAKHEPNPRRRQRAEDFVTREPEPEAEPEPETPAPEAPADEPPTPLEHAPGAAEAEGATEPTTPDEPRQCLWLSVLSEISDQVQLPYAALAAALDKPELEQILADDLLGLLVPPGIVVARLADAEEEGESAGPGVAVAAGAQVEPGLNVTLAEGAFTSQLLGYFHYERHRVSVLPAIHVSGDGLRAHFVHFPSPAATALQAEWIEAALAERGVTTGIDADAVQGLASQPPAATAKTEVLLASGEAARDGADARIEFEFDMEKRSGELLPDGSIDLRERNAAVGVAQGQVVGRCVPGTPGQEGRTVRGEPIPATDGAQRDFTAGDNVRVDTADGEQRFLSEIDGHISVQGDAVHVRAVFTVSGDVDYDTGNIDVPGDVEVSGSIRAGFSVKAGGTVTVGGTAEPGSEIHAHGDVIVSKGIFGDRTRVVSLGDVTTKYIQNGTVVAHGDITAGAYIINGHVRAGGRIRVEAGGGSRGGSIVGGQVVATGGVQASRIGSAETDRTVVGVGAAPEDMARATQLRKEHTTASRQAGSLKSELGVASSQDRDQIQRLLRRTPSPRMEAVEAKLTALRELERQSQAMESEIEELDQRIQRVLQQARVQVSDHVFADVQIQFGAQTRNVSDDLVGGCEFYHTSDGNVQWRSSDSDVSGPED